MNSNKLMNTTTAVLVIFLALSAFVLSYDALRALAATNGINGKLSYLWPLTLDGFIIVASLSVLRNSLLAEKTFYAWSLIILFALASIVFNIVHAPGNLVARAIAAIPPLALLLSFELLMSQCKSEVKRRMAIDSLAELTTQANELTATIENLTTEVDSKQAKVDQLKNELDDLRKEQRGQFAGQNRFIPGDQAALELANETRQEIVERRRGQLADLLEDNPDLTNGQLAELLEVSVSTIKADKKALNGQLNGR